MATSSGHEQETSTTKSLTLICIDGSEHSLRAFNWYCERLHHEGDEVGLVHVHIPPDMPSLGLIHGTIELYTREIEGAVEKSKTTARKFKELCTERGMEAHVWIETLDDSVGHTIYQVAKTKHANLVVIGQRGIGTIRRTLFGSVSDYVLHHIHIPTCVVPPP